MKNKKRQSWIAIAAAAALCLGGTAGVMQPMTASALSIVASIQTVTAEKTTLAVGESVPLTITWTTGAKQDVLYASSDESVVTVDSDGVVTGVGAGTATVTLYLSSGSSRTLEFTVSEEAVPSVCYNTSELTPGQQLKAGDRLHYDDQNLGSCANVVNAEGGYDLVYLNEGSDYTLPVDTQVVATDSLILYLAPELEGVTYVDARTLQPGDVIDQSATLLCYDYTTNGRVLPVYLPSYYSLYVGDGTIQVAAIDAEAKTLTLELTEEEPSSDETSYLVTDKGVVFHSENDAATYIVSGKQDATITRSSNGITIFTPQTQEEGTYLVSAVETCEEIVTADGTSDSEESGHFHYFYPIFNQYLVTQSAGGSLHVESLGSENYYSEEQVEEERSKLLSGDSSACYDVMAEDDGFWKDSSLSTDYYRYVYDYMYTDLLSLPNDYEAEHIWRTFVTTTYSPYGTKSEFCAFLFGMEDIATDDPVVRVYDPELDAYDNTKAELTTAEEIEGTWGVADYISTAVLYRVQAKADGKVTICAVNSEYPFQIRDGVFCYTQDSSQQPSTATGDINRDGSVTLADAVLLQRYVLNDPNLAVAITLAADLTDITVLDYCDWTAGDLCADGVLNSMDLSKLKQQLLEIDAE